MRCQKIRLFPYGGNGEDHGAEELARSAGIDMKFGMAVFCNTRNAHRLMKFAYAQYGSGVALKLNFNLFAAYFTQNLILDDENLVKIAGQTGMDREMAKSVLKSWEYEAEVVADERNSAARGIYAMPYFDFAGKFSVGGAMSLARFKKAINEML